MKQRNKMDFDIASLKYAMGMVVSSILSYTLWAYKKHVKRIEVMNDTMNTLQTNQKVTDVEIRAIKEDVTEIKSTLKLILKRL